MRNYDDAVAALVDVVRRMAASNWSPTPERKLLEGLAQRLEGLAQDLDDIGEGQTSAELEHDAEHGALAYKAVLRGMRALAESTRRAAENLPDPRQRPAVPFAALALVHLLYQHGCPRPTLTNSAAAVQELRSVCERAGIVRSDEVFRNAMASALREFDPIKLPPGVAEVLGLQG